MRTFRLSLAGAVIVALLCGASGTIVAQDHASGATEATSEVVWELAIPSAALPDDFVKLVLEDWTLDPGIDTSGEFASVLGNEALRGRGLVIESGEVEVTPATEAMLWRNLGGDAETIPAGETVRLGVSEGIYLPAMPDADVDKELPMAFVNPGTEPATARSFHLHQEGGSFYGYLPGITLGPWDMAGSFDPATREAMNGVDILLRLTRSTGAPGTLLPTAAAPAFGLYFVEDGHVEQVTSGPGGEYVFDWPTGRNALLSRTEDVEASLRVVGDSPATLLEFAAIPSAAEDEAVATWVTMISSECTVVEGGETTSTVDVEQYRGARITCTEDWSDPRVSGTKTVVYNDDCYEGGAPCVYWGSQALQGPDGAWSGWVNGTLDPDRGATGYAVMVGNDGYEGLTFISHALGPMGETPSGYGLVFEGEPPPMTTVPIE